MTQSDDLDLLLGRLVRASAELDMCLRDIAQQLLWPRPDQLDERGAAPATPEWLRLTGSGHKRLTAFSALIDLIWGVASDHPHLGCADDTLARRLDALLTRSKDAYERRNRWVHDPPLSIHPPERVPGGPTHRRHRIDRPAPTVDIDLQELSLLVQEIRLCSQLCTWTQSQLMFRNMAAFGLSHPGHDDLDSWGEALWRAFAALPPL